MLGSGNISLSNKIPRADKNEATSSAVTKAKKARIEGENQTGTKPKQYLTRRALKDISNKPPAANDDHQSKQTKKTRTVDICLALPAPEDKPLAKEDVFQVPDDPLPCSSQNDIDRDPQMVQEYAEDIHVYLRRLEEEHRPSKKPCFTSVTPKMRAIVVDWLVQVHSQYSLLQETLHLSVAILDRYLVERVVTKKNLQLLGVTAMFLASKYEEIYPLELEIIVSLTDSAYTESDVLAMEIKIVKTLNYFFNYPLVPFFLRRNSKHAEVDTATHALTKYLAELTLLKSTFCNEPASKVAAAAIYLTFVWKGSELQDWDDKMKTHTGYDGNSLRPLAKAMAQFAIEMRDKAKLIAIPQKYDTAKLYHVSKMEKSASLEFYCRGS